MAQDGLVKDVDVFQEIQAVHKLEVMGPAEKSVRVRDTQLCDSLAENSVTNDYFTSSWGSRQSA